MKKWLVTLTALLSCLFVLGGCSSDSSGDSATTTESTEQQAEEAKTEEAEEAESEEEAEDTSSSDEESLTIRVGTGGTSDVFSIVNPDTEEWEGIDAEVWKAIKEETGWTIELKQNQFDGLIGELQSERIDAVSNHMGVTDERNEQALPSAPYSTTSSVIIIRSDNGEIASAEDLAGKKVGVRSGQSVQPIVEELAEEIGFTVQTYQENSEMYNDLIMERTDAIVGMEPSIKNFSEKLNVELKGIGDPLEINNVVFYLQKNENGEELAAKLNPVIEKLVEDGTFSEITKKWTNVDLPAAIQK